MIGEGCVLDKVTLMNIYVSARKRVEQGDLDIASESEFIAELEQRDLDATMAKVILSELISRRDADLKEMERLLNVMDQQEPVSELACGEHDGVQDAVGEQEDARARRIAHGKTGTACAMKDGR